MKLKKKVLFVSLITSVAVLSFAGCGAKKESPTDTGMFAEERADEPSQVSAMNVYSYIDFTCPNGESEDSLTLEMNMDVKYEITKDDRFLYETDGKYDLMLGSVESSQNVHGYYESVNGENITYSMDGETNQWSKSVVDAAQESYSLDAKTAIALRDCLRDLWQDAKKEKKTQTINDQEYIVLKLKLAGADYIAFMDKFMPMIGGGNDWKEQVKKFNKEYKNVTLEEALDCFSVGVIGYVSKDTKKLKMVDIDMSGFDLATYLDKLGINSIENSMLAGYDASELKTNTVFMSIVYLDDKESIDIPEDVKNIEATEEIGGN